MTRAEKELYILLTERKGKKNYLRDYLFSIPEFEAFTRGNRIVLGTKSPAADENVPEMGSRVPLSFADLTGGSKWALGVKTSSSGAAGYGARFIKARKAGDAIHRALSLIDTLPVNDASIASACRRAVSIERSPEITDDVIASVRKFFGEPEFRHFFEPGPGISAYNEKEIVDEQGNTFKLDRLIVRPDVIEIVDYKTGASHLPHHAEQVTRYGSLVSDIYPDKEIRKYLLYIENGEVLEV
jgi:hypothetical protein